MRLGGKAPGAAKAAIMRETRQRRGESSGHEGRQGWETRRQGHWQQGQRSCREARAGDKAAESKRESQSQRARERERRRGDRGSRSKSSAHAGDQRAGDKRAQKQKDKQQDLLPYGCGVASFSHSG